MKSLFTTSFKNRTFFILIFFVFFNFYDAFAQQMISINSEPATSNFLRSQSSLQPNNLAAKAEQIRQFNFNRQLKEIRPNNNGDILLLDFFENKKYKAVIENVTINYDNTIGITARILDTEFGYCFISISGEDVSIVADLPRLDEQYLTGGTNGNTYVAQHKMSEVSKNILPSSGIEIPADNNQKTRSVTALASDNLEDPVTIDIMFVYTKNAREWAGGTSQMNNIITESLLRSNLVMANSLTNVTFNLVHKYETTYNEVNSEEDLYRLKNTGDGYLEEVHPLRDQYKADLVMLLPMIDFTGGLAFLLNNESGAPAYGFGLSRVQQSSWTYTVVHEIGHNMGCVHHKNQGETGLFPYSYGYAGVTNLGTKFTTVMSYESGDHLPTPDKYPNIPYFSNPEITFEGVSIGDVNANNALTIRRTKHVISRYQQSLTSNDATLKSITTSSGTLSPAFSSSVTDYTINVDNNVDKITVTGTANHNGATVAGNVTNQSLILGNNLITLTVTAEDENTTKAYTITVNRGAISGGGGVTIGALEDPQVFSVLELISNGNSGLRLPQLTTAQRDAMTTSSQFIAAKNTTAKGLLIFNSSTNCVEVWNGSTWISLH